MCGTQIFYPIANISLDQMRTECIVAFGQAAPTVMDFHETSRYGGISRPNIFTLDQLNALSQAVGSYSTVQIIFELTNERLVTTCILSLVVLGMARLKIS